MPEGAKPTGVVAVLLFPDGRSLCSASDFDTSGYGGFTLHESQEHRAKAAIAREVVGKLCSDDVVKALDTAECDLIIAPVDQDARIQAGNISSGRGREMNEYPLVCAWRLRALWGKDSPLYGRRCRIVGSRKPECPAR